MPSARDTFIIETFNLSNVNPEQWLKFIQALQWYTKEVVETSVMAPSSEIAASAGYARHALIQLNEFQNIRELYRKVRG